MPTDGTVLFNVALALAPLLVLGNYGYTYMATRGSAKKSDIEKLQTRVDDIYKLLVELRGASK